MDIGGGQVSNGAKAYSIAEAAELLGVSKKTVRRRIHKGELPAELEEGPYGPEYRIPAESINTAQQIVDVVRVERSIDPMNLAMAIVQALDERDRGLQEEIAQLRQQVAELAQALDERDLKLVNGFCKALDDRKEREKASQRRWRWPWEKPTE